MTAEPFALTSPGPDARDLETDHAKREDDPTPRGVVRAAIEAAGRGPGVIRDVVKLYTSKRPFRVLDACAGYGCWASEFRRWWQLTRPGIPWPVHITGVELFEPRRADLEKWCDEVVMGDWREAMCAIEDTEDGAVDIAIGNPPLSFHTHEDPEQSMPAVLLRHAPAVLLLHTQQQFLRGEPGRRVWRAYPPAASWMVPGSVKFRTGHNPICSKCAEVNAGRSLRFGVCNGCGARLKSWGSDSRCYQVSLWLRGHEGPTALHLLPDLDAAARRWTVPPGSEEPSEDLPAAPGWSP